MDEAADVQLQRAVDNFTAAATPCELPDACTVTALDDVDVHIGGRPSGNEEVLHSVQQLAVSDAMPAPMAEALAAHNTASVTFGREPAILQPAGSAQVLHRAQPIHPQLLPERLPMHTPLLSPRQQQQQLLQQQQQAALRPARGAVAAFLSSLQPAEMHLLLGSMPQDRLLRMLSLLPHQGRLVACLWYVV
jgi:hypothetical protein